jgi:molybdenum cofactor biosynthesis enzyme MoaA
VRVVIIEGKAINHLIEEAEVGKDLHHQTIKRINISIEDLGQGQRTEISIKITIIIEEIREMIDLGLKIEIEIDLDEIISLNC